MSLFAYQPDLPQELNELEDHVLVACILPKQYKTLSPRNRIGIELLALIKNATLHCCLRLRDPKDRDLAWREPRYAYPHFEDYGTFESIAGTLVRNALALWPQR